MLLLNWGREHLSLLALGVGVFAAGQAHGQFEYSYLDLGTFGGRNSRAHDINERGDVVGWARSRTPGIIRDYDWRTGTWSERQGFVEVANAFVYEDGQMIDLGRTDQASEAWAINNSGRVVGVVGNADNTRRAFRSGLGPLDETADEGFFHPQIQSSFAWDINDNRQIVGNTYFPDGHGAFIYDRNEMRNLGNMLGRASWTRAVNNAGIVVGDSFLNANSTGPIHAYAHNSRTGETLDLGTLARGNYPYGVSSHAWDINNSGQIVGNSNVDVPSGTYGSREHAFLWEDGEMFDLGVLAGQGHSNAYGVNEHGHVVGRSGQHAFLWRDGQMFDLNALADLPDDWTLAEAHAINNKGQIVGFATNSRDDEHAFLLTPLPSGETGIATASADEASLYLPLEGTFSASVYPLPVAEQDPAMGDTNYDGSVDLGDLSQLTAYYGTPGGAAWIHGDFDYDGDVDLVDLTRLATHYSAGQAQAFTDFQALTSVPEPACAALAMLGLLATSRRRRRLTI